MRILILGGTSFFGKETAIRLHKAGNEVTVFSRRAPVEGLPLDIRQTRGDRTVEIDLSRMAVEPWDVIIDNICFTAEDAQKAIRVFSGRTGLYLFTSSASVYSVLEGSSSPFRENQTELLALKPQLKEKYAYGLGKYGAEILYPDYAWLKENGFNFEASPFSMGGDFVLDISKAEKELGWASTPAAAWLEETINWYLFSYTGPAPANYASRKSELELARKWIMKL